MLDVIIIRYNEIKMLRNNMRIIIIALSIAIFGTSLFALEGKKKYEKVIYNIEKYKQTPRAFT
jgi:hypothetical protein